ncbi:MAG: YkgJ family cysteine cluster protein, partial [Thermodesulfovibrionales bacterium]
QDGYVAPTRIRFPGDEETFPWLSLILDAYFIVDRGIAEDIRAVRAMGRQVACAKGCFACCAVQKTIPVYPLELVGITWYAVEKVTGSLREQLKISLRNHEEGCACPFLSDSLCAIHPMRPLACRQFIVMGRACGGEEDPYHTRKGDVMPPGSA